MSDEMENSLETPGGYSPRPLGGSDGTLRGDSTHTTASSHSGHSLQGNTNMPTIITAGGSNGRAKGAAPTRMRAVKLSSPQGNSSGSPHAPPSGSSNTLSDNSRNRRSFYRTGSSMSGAASPVPGSGLTGGRGVPTVRSSRNLKGNSLSIGSMSPGSSFVTGLGLPSAANQGDAGGGGTSSRRGSIARSEVSDTDPTTRAEKVERAATLKQKIQHLKERLDRERARVADYQKHIREQTKQQEELQDNIERDGKRFELQITEASKIATDLKNQVLRLSGKVERRQRAGGQLDTKIASAEAELRRNKAIRASQFLPSWGLDDIIDPQDATKNEEDERRRSVHTSIVSLDLDEEFPLEDFEVEEDIDYTIAELKDSYNLIAEQLLGCQPAEESSMESRKRQSTSQLSSRKDSTTVSSTTASGVFEAGESTSGVFSWTQKGVAAPSPPLGGFPAVNPTTAADTGDTTTPHNGDPAQGNSSSHAINMVRQSHPQLADHAFRFTHMLLRACVEEATLDDMVVPTYDSIADSDPVFPHPMRVAAPGT